MQCLQNVHGATRVTATRRGNPVRGLSKRRAVINSVWSANLSCEVTRATPRPHWLAHVTDGTICKLCLSELVKFVTTMQMRPFQGKRGIFMYDAGLMYTAYDSLFSFIHFTKIRHLYLGVTSLWREHYSCANASAGKRLPSRSEANWPELSTR